jgi:FAD/FMN-containing dehydrogenase
VTRATAGESIDLRALLAPIVGDERLATPGDAARVDGVLPGVVARPGSVDEVRAIARVARSAGSRSSRPGRGRHLDVGAPPERCDVLLRSSDSMR